MPMGTVLGHRVHSCPHLPCNLWWEESCSPSEPRGWSGSFYGCKIASLILISLSMKKVAGQASSPLPLGAEEGRCVEQLKGPGTSPFGALACGGAKRATACPGWSQVALLGGLRCLHHLAVAGWPPSSVPVCTSQRLS